MIDLGFVKVSITMRKEEEIDESLYKNSTIRAFLQERLDNDLPLKLAVLDIDGTMTGDTNHILETRKKINSLGYVTIFNTSRTEELIMSQDAYRKSKELGELQRPAPRMGIKDGKRIYIKPEESESQSLLDPFIIVGATGSKIYILQKDGSYMQDKEYEKKMYQSSNEWRTKTVEVLDYITSQKISFSLADIEYKENYEKYITDVWPPDYRMQINFSNERKKKVFLRVFANFLDDTNLSPDIQNQIKNIRLHDESMYHKDEYSIYLTPINASKHHAVDHIIQQLSEELGIMQNDLFVFFAGNTQPDFIMGLLSAKKIHRAILLIPGGSSLTPLMQLDKNTFSQRECIIIDKRKSKLGRGIYEFFLKDQTNIRYVINGNERFPHTKEVESVYKGIDVIDALLTAKEL